MRIRDTFALAGILSLTAGMLPAQEDGIHWFDNYKAALAEAKRTGKPLFLEYRCEP